MFLVYNMPTSITPDWKKIEMIKIVQKYDVLYRRDKRKEKVAKERAWQMVLNEFSHIDGGTNLQTCQNVWRRIRENFVASQPNVLTPYLRF
ncbi:CLUMA_CG000774, isoform A [Clunio marinus]|uniref:CLUMA_CG000774, isoform A n=1 Tax=Clunio marinus TaxID=568069 RepID=A0A1J1HKH0_9DIPT|nr:CLUMA_CG000774, isoform A [Clunio marinus]